LKAEARRLFFALWPSDALRESIQRSNSDAIAASGGRIIPAGNYHVTLAFIGAVAATRVAEIEQLGAAIRAPSFDVAFTAMEFWPRSGVLCLTSSHAPSALLGLAQTLHFRLFGEPPSHPFRPHVTLARDLNIPAAAISIEPISWPVRDFVLCESHSRSGGSQYEVLARWPLL
jgi:RNA 2',3'-cyclic 3'-phosphodiesterase